jgi:hypothetical protein
MARLAAAPEREPGPVGTVAVLLGLAYAGAAWQINSLRDEPPLNSLAAQAIARFVLAIAVGGMIAWWRCRTALPEIAGASTRR